MTKIIKSDLTKEMIEKAMQCKTADKLLELAEAEGYEMTRDEAEAYIAEMADYELDDETLKSQKHQTPCPSYCSIAEA